MPTKPTVDELIRQLEHVHIEEARIVEELKRARVREGRRSTPVAVAISVPVRLTTDDFQVGRRVQITNARDERNHERGVVTRVTDTRVQLRTNSGHLAWRAPNNLRLV